MTDDRAGIIRLAEGYMGWQVVSSDDRKVFADRPDEDGVMYRVCLWVRPDLHTMLSVWNPFESHADAFDLEAAIPEDKRGRYVFALTLLVCPEGVNGPNPYDISWRLIHATPRQRSEAALAVLEGK